METGQRVLASKQILALAKTRLLYSLLEKSYELLVDQKVGSVARQRPKQGLGQGDMIRALDGYVKKGHEVSASEHVFSGDFFSLLEEDGA